MDYFVYVPHSDLSGIHDLVMGVRDLDGKVKSAFIEPGSYYSRTESQLGRNETISRIPVEDAVRIHIEGEFSISQLQHYCDDRMKINVGFPYFFQN